MSPPSLILIVGLEGRPRLLVDALYEGEEIRLHDYLRHSPEVVVEGAAVLLSYVSGLIDAAEEAEP